MEVPFYTSDQIHQLPTQPGIYKFYNQEGTLIYVGKAKNIKKRVSSYFTKAQTANKKTRKMVSEIRRIEFTIVNSEFDALLLENNLIKTNLPRYNIMLRDDKSYPYVCVTNERFPRIISTRKRIPNYGTYFGPYSSVRAMYNVLELIRSLYTIRTCTYNLSEENIAKGKFKVCLEYHIGNCKGMCEGLQSEEDYNHDIEQAKILLKGNMNLGRAYFKKKMLEASENMEYEKAHEYKEKLLSLENFQSKSLVVNEKIGDTDVVTIVSDEKAAFVNYLKIKDGTIIFTKTIEVKKKLDEKDEEIIALVAVELIEKFDSHAKEIISNIPIKADLGIEKSVPKIGDKKKLVDMSIKNALFYKKDRYNTNIASKQKDNYALVALQKDLQLKKLPIHIECFDNSNIQGTNPVASMVCFKNGKPSKKDYRHFHIKTVVGPDDFASMAEVTFRRYKRQLEEKAPLPDLIVIDGGKGQLNAACNSLKSLGLYGQVPIIGIAKRLEEIYFPEDQYPIHIDKKSPALILLQKVRDEAHRFAITFHRDKRSKNSFNTQLESIKGIGKKTTDTLLSHFKSISKIRSAPLEELEALIGKDKARIVKERLQEL